MWEPGYEGGEYQVLVETPTLEIPSPFPPEDVSPSRHGVVVRRMCV